MLAIARLGETILWHFVSVVTVRLLSKQVAFLESPKLPEESNLLAVFSVTLARGTNSGEDAKGLHFTNYVSAGIHPVYPIPRKTL